MMRESTFRSRQLFTHSVSNAGGKDVVIGYAERLVMTILDRSFAACFVLMPDSGPRVIPSIFFPLTAALMTFRNPCNCIASA